MKEQESNLAYRFKLEKKSRGQERGKVDGELSKLRAPKLFENTLVCALLKIY